MIKCLRALLSIDYLDRSLGLQLSSRFELHQIIAHSTYIMFLSHFFALLALSSSAVAFPAAGNHFLTDGEFTSSVREKLTGPPPGWTRDESFTLDKDTSTLSLRIHLAHQDMDKFHELAMNVWQSSNRLRTCVEPDQF